MAWAALMSWWATRSRYGMGTGMGTSFAARQGDCSRVDFARAELAEDTATAALCCPHRVSSLCQGLFLCLFYPCVPQVGAKPPLWIPRYKYCGGVADFTQRNRHWCTPLLSVAIGEGAVGTSSPHTGCSSFLRDPIPMPWAGLGAAGWVLQVGTEPSGDLLQQQRPTAHVTPLLLGGSSSPQAPAVCW